MIKKCDVNERIPAPNNGWMLEREVVGRKERLIKEETGIIKGMMWRKKDREESGRD